jgi:hypothetical protein
MEPLRLKLGDWIEREVNGQISLELTMTVCDMAIGSDAIIMAPNVIIWRQQ